MSSIKQKSLTYTAVNNVRAGQKLETATGEKIHFTREMKIDFTKRICALYAGGKHTLPDCCEVYGVTVGRFRTWVMPHLDIEQLILDGTELPKTFVMECRELYADAKLRAMFNYKDNVADIARKGLQKRAEGYEAEEYTAERVVDTRLVLDDGTDNPNFGQMMTVKEKVKRFQVAPDPTTLIFLATNVMPETFKHRNDLNHSGNVNISNSGLESLTDTQLKEKRQELEFRMRKLQEAKKTA